MSQVVHVQSKFNLIPDVLLRHIFEYTLEYFNTEHLLISKRLAIAMLEVLKYQVEVLIRNPPIKLLYGDTISSCKLSAVALSNFIKFSYEHDDPSLIQQFEGFGYFFKNSLLSNGVSDSLKVASLNALKKLILERVFYEHFLKKFKDFNFRLFLEPIVVEILALNVDSLEYLHMASEFYNHPPKFLSFVFNDLPAGLKQRNVPANLEERNRLLNLLEAAEFKFKLSLFIGITALASLLFAGSMTAHGFNSLIFCGIYGIFTPVLYFAFKKIIQETMFTSGNNRNHTVVDVDVEE